MNNKAQGDGEPLKTLEQNCYISRHVFWNTFTDSSEKTGGEDTRLKTG